MRAAGILAAPDRRRQAVVPKAAVTSMGAK
jgi:hypothetical protein